jgi:hypothetical protein
MYKVKVKMEYPSNLNKNKRAFLIVTIIVFVFTAGNLLIHKGDQKLGYARYERFGISLDYSQLMTLRENGFGGPEVTESSGSVQVNYQGNHVEQYGVFWASTTDLPIHMRSLEGAIEYVFAIAAMDGTKISGSGPTMSIVHNGHQMVYQTFILEEQGFNIPGIMGSLKCDDRDQFFWFYFVYLSEPEKPAMSQQELEQGWLGYLNGFRCHA